MIGHGTLMSAIVVANLFGRLTYFDSRIEEASADLGARPLETFWYVTPAEHQDHAHRLGAHHIHTVIR